MTEIEMLQIRADDLILQLEEITTKRELLQVKRKIIENRKNTKKHVVTELQKHYHNTSSNPHLNTFSIPKTPEVLLNYSPSTKRTCMKIADVCKDGSILIYGQNGRKQIAKKYNMRTLSWLKHKLPVLSRRQKIESNFWGNVAEAYSKRFTPISKTTVEKLCYIIDSGAADKWFRKWEMLKDNEIQGTLDGGIL